MDSIHLEIRGRVQGVGFRWFVVDAARELRLKGWVRNKPDGNVEIAAAGEPDALAQLEIAVAKGPPGARVEQVQKLAPTPLESLESPFGIAR